jgi:pyruvate,water dikinase
MANPLHWDATETDVLWSPGNVSEAIPGVSTALNWSFIDDPIELAARRAFYAMGVLRRAELMPGERAEERFMVCFYGRTVANIEAMRRIGDRTPGTSANAVEEQLFGVVRPEAVNHPTYAYAPAVAVRMPPTAARLRSEQLRLRRHLVSWWRGAVLQPPPDPVSARILLREARDRYTRAFELGTLASMLSQALYDQVVLLAEAAGRPGLQHRLATGYVDLLETRLLIDLWELARGQMDMSSFLLRDGFHGPGEGQMASHVWREDQVPLLAVLERYAGLGPDAHPAAREARQAGVRERAEAELVGALSPLRVRGARVVLRLARLLIPQREIGKANYTQALDGARIAARVIGRELERDGRLDDADDVFHLTYDELVADAPPADCRALAAQRRAIREDYLTTELAEKWMGPPARVPIDPVPIARVPIAGVAATNGNGILRGEGVGGGTVTARARVVIDPADEDLQAGEILVCHATDPGWASLFHLAAGVAVDMGGTMSHAAIVARELGIPCVTCTVDGTRRIETGSLVRLDGDGGTVEIIERGAGT